MRQRSPWCRIALLGFPLSLALTGCLIAPIKMRTLTKDPAGNRALVPSDVPIPGKTTREQIEEKFQTFEMESGEPALFWGHFEKSSWALAWVVGSYTGGYAGGERLWSEYEILATFDENDIVRSFDVFPQKTMVQRVANLQKLGLLPPLDLSTQIELDGAKVIPSFMHVTLELSSDELKATVRHPEPKPSKKPKKAKPPVIASIPVAQIVGISIESQNRDPARPFSLGLKFSQKTPVGKSLNVFLTARDSLTVIRWYEQQSATQKPAAIAEQH